MICQCGDSTLKGVGGGALKGGDLSVWRQGGGGDLSVRRLGSEGDGYKTAC